MEKISRPIGPSPQRAQRQVDQAAAKPIARAGHTEAMNRQNPPQAAAVVAALAHHRVIGIGDRQLVVMAHEGGVVVAPEVERDRSQQQVVAFAALPRRIPAERDRLVVASRGVQHAVADQHVPFDLADEDVLRRDLARPCCETAIYRFSANVRRATAQHMGLHIRRLGQRHFEVVGRIPAVVVGK